MSLKPTLLTVTSVLACGALLFTTSHLSSEGAPAAPEKSAKFMPSSRKIGKPNQALDVGIESVNGFPETNNEAAVLRATIRSQLEPGTQISYRWVLPDGASMDSGNPDGLLQIPEAGQELVLDISVRGFSSEGNVRNLKIELSAADGVGGAAVFSSHPTRSDLSRGYRETKTGRTLDPAVKGVNSKPRLPAGVNL